MSVRIQYAYLKQQTWLYRRNYPRELQAVLGQAMKQSLKTGDARVARARAADEDLARVRQGAKHAGDEDPYRVSGAEDMDSLADGADTEDAGDRDRTDD